MLLLDADELGEEHGHDARDGEQGEHGHAKRHEAPRHSCNSLLEHCTVRRTEQLSAQRTHVELKL